MNQEIVKTILSSEFDARVDGESFHVDADRRLVVILQHNSGIMQVPKVHSLTFKADYLVLTTDENHYYVEPTGVFGLKAGDPELEKSEKRTGFRR